MLLVEPLFFRGWGGGGMGDKMLLGFSLSISKMGPLPFCESLAPPCYLELSHLLSLAQFEPWEQSQGSQPLEV